MKTILSLVLVLFLFKSAFGQIASIPVPELIEAAKKTALPIVCFEIADNDTITSQGTAVVLGHESQRLFLTCEHVLAIKDSTNRFIKYYSNIFANVNNVDGTTTALRLNIEHVDKTLDFALLSISKHNMNFVLSLFNQLKLQYVQRSLWKSSTDLKEGEPIIYIGYPMLKRIDKHNYPLSRTGTIAQIVSKRDNFLIDGFVQHGHSGSPVFLIREKGIYLPPQWSFYLIGITRAFPAEFTEIFEEVRWIRDPGKKALINPGFTSVTTMNKIIPILKEKFGLAK